MSNEQMCVEYCVSSGIFLQQRMPKPTRIYVRASVCAHPPIEPSAPESRAPGCVPAPRAAHPSLIWFAMLMRVCVVVGC